MVVSRRRAVREGPRPRAAPARLHAARSASCSTSTRPRRPRRGRLRARRPGRGPRPVRGPRRPARRLPGDRGARGPRRPVRRRDRVAALVLDVHPALARRGRAWSRSRPPPSSPPSTASWRRSPRSRTPRAPGRRRAAAGRPTSASCSTSLPGARARSSIAADEDVEPALRDHWEDVCAAFHDTDAHHLYVKPDGDPRGARRARAAAAVERSPARSRSSSAPRPPSSPPARCARPSRSSRSSCAPATRRVVTWPQRGAGERAAYNLGRAKASLRGRRQRPRLRRGRRCATASSRPQLKLAAIPEHRLIHRRKAAAERPARAAAAACCARSPTCAPATSSSTRTTASRASRASTPRPSPASRATTSTSSSRARTRSSCRSTSSRRSRATSAPTARTRRCPSSAARAGRR